MCGIAGFIHNQRLIDTHLLRSLSESMKRRGPDDYGFAGFAEAPLKSILTKDPRDLNHCYGTFVHRRLSIVDLSERGWQPMHFQDLTITYNGEVYNYIELRDELKALGETFESDSDTEVVLKAFLRWGTDSFSKLNGMFALAITDQAKKKVYLARDCFGIKPLYFYGDKENFAFASQIQTLLEIPWISRRLDEQSVFNYLRYNRSDSQSQTLFKNIFQVMPGCYVELDIETLQYEQTVYWTPVISDGRFSSRQQAVDSLRELFLKNVALHMRADVPVGSLLSGGIDSSSIVMSMRRLFPDHELHTFSFLASNKDYDESPWIQLVNKEARTIPHETKLNSANLFEDLESFISAQDLPVGGTSTYAQFKVFKSVHEAGIKVVLDGQGADELFAGYGQYLSARLASYFAQGQFLKAFSFFKACQSGLGLGQKEMLLRAFSFFLPDAVKGFGQTVTGRKAVPSWIDEGWVREQKIATDPVWGHAESKEILKEQLLNSLVDSSLPMLLRYEDRNSMHFSVESRVPFLTREMIDLAYSLPEEFIVSSQGQTKSIFREAMRGLVPDPILDRKDKIGFATPERAWLQELGPWIQKVLDQTDEIKFPVFNMSELRNEWQGVCSGHKPFDFRIWRWVNFISWAQSTDAQF